MIVTFDKPQTSPSKAAEAAVASAAASVADANVKKVTPITNSIVAVTLDQPVTTSQAGRIGDAAEETSNVKAAEPATTFTAATTNDTYYQYLWNLRAGSPSRYGVNAESAWATTTGAGVVVGVLDTGITAHPDLTGSTSRIVGGNVIAGYDFITNVTTAGDGNGRDNDPTDVGDYCSSTGRGSSWHGTHVSGIIAAIRNNNMGVVGVAPGAKVEPLRVLGHCSGTETDIIAAILWGSGNSVSGIPTNPNPAQVLNLSLAGTGSCSVALQTAINAAVAKGTVVVVGAGNNGTELSTMTPASCNNVIRVTASAFDGTRASYSNYGTASYPATIAAPGGTGTSADNANDWIISTWNSGTSTVGTPAYAGQVGTSMATPHVSAVAALLKSINSSLTPAQIKTILTSSATPMPSCSTVQCGAGVVNAANAVAALTSDPVLGLGTPTISGYPGVGGPLKATLTTSSSASYTYQWRRNGAAIATATSSRYTTTAADKGTAVSVTVTVNKDGQTASKTSAPVTVVANPVSTLTTPQLAGIPKVGATVQAGSFAATGATISYQWLRNGTQIPGATSASRTLNVDDRGNTISVKVTATFAGQTASKSSLPTSRVQNGTIKKFGSPTASGTFKKGRTVKASAGKWSPTPAKVSYQWLRNGKKIRGASKQIYKLTGSDKAKSISVRVTLSRPGYTTVSAASARHKVK